MSPAPRRRSLNRPLSLLAAIAGLAAALHAAPRSPEELFKEGAGAYSRRDYASAIACFEELVKVVQPGPGLDSIHFTLASAKLLKGDAAAAADAFRDYIRIYPLGEQIDNARLGLAQALLKAGRVDETLQALRTLRGIEGGVRGIDNHAALAGLAVEIADVLLAERRFAAALELLQTSPGRTEILADQALRVRELDQLLRRAQLAGELGAGATQLAHRDALASRLETARAVLEQVEKQPAFDLPRLLRQARCHLELNEPWEAIVLYEEILARFPESPDRAYALHGLILARQQAGRPADALSLCRRFLDTFPGHALAPEIAVLGGQIALDRQQTAQAESFFGSAIDQSQGQLRERVLFQLGLARFSRRDWAGARDMLDRYVGEFPRGEWAENAAYRSALTWFLDTSDAERYAKSEKSLQAFVKDHPSSTYLPDAHYRLAVCKFAFQEYDQALAACTDWEKRFPTDAMLAEVLSLKGDVLKALQFEDRALESYLRAASAAATDEVLAYTLGEAAHLLEAKKDWPRLGELFKTQLQRQPDSPLALGWLYWVARAEARAGRPEQAWDYLADRIGPSLEDAGREDVENVLALMAQITARQRRPADGGDAPVSPADTLRQRLGVQPPPLTDARLRYYESQFLRLTRKPDEAARILASIGRQTPPDALSPALLAEAGQALLQAGDRERAGTFFSALQRRFPSSPYRDYAYTGLGDIALSSGDAGSALKNYEDAVNLAGARHRLREATLGKARALFELGRLDEAEKLFESIAATKQWRGEATAISLHHLGLITVRQGDLPKGVAFFQRVFVSQGRHPEWVAKAYLASAESFEKLGKSAEAAATYREMLRNPRIQDRPETAVARERLEKLPAS